MPRHPRASATKSISLLTLIGSLLATSALAATSMEDDPINLVEPYETVEGKQEAPCPSANESLVVVGFGQSNGSNHLLPRREDTTGAVYNFYQGKCYTATDPMLGATGTGGSIWVPLGQRMAALTHKNIVISTFGVGGSTIQRWEDRTDLGARMDANLTALKQVYPQVDYFLWVQGESDVDGNAPAYGRTLARVAALTKQYFPHSLFGASSTSFCADRMSDAITQTQKEIATTTPGMFWLGDTDQFRSAEYRRDNCHLSERGGDAVVGEFMKYLTPKLETIRLGGEHTGSASGV